MRTSTKVGATLVGLGLFAAVAATALGHTEAPETWTCYEGGSAAFTLSSSRMPLEADEVAANGGFVTMRFQLVEYTNGPNEPAATEAREAGYTFSCGPTPPR